MSASVSFSGQIPIQLNVSELESELSHRSIEGRYYSSSAEVELKDRRYSTTFLGCRSSSLTASGRYHFEGSELKLTDDRTGDWTLYVSRPLGFYAIEANRGKSGSDMISRLARMEGDLDKMGPAVMKLEREIQVWESKEPSRGWGFPIIPLESW